MKKSVSSVLLGLFVAVMFFSCNKDDEEIAIEANIVGSWVVESTYVMIDGKSLEDYVEEKVAGLGGSYDEQYAEAFAVELTEDLYTASVWTGTTFEFKEDKTVLIAEKGHTEQGTWSASGKKLTVTLAGGIPQTFEVRAISSSRASLYTKYDEEAIYTQRGMDVTVELKK